MLKPPSTTQRLPVQQREKDLTAVPQSPVGEMGLIDKLRMAPQLARARRDVAVQEAQIAGEAYLHDLEHAIEQKSLLRRLRREQQVTEERAELTQDLNEVRGMYERRTTESSIQHTRGTLDAHDSYKAALKRRLKAKEITQDRYEFELSLIEDAVSCELENNKRAAAKVREINNHAFMSAMTVTRKGEP